VIKRHGERGRGVVWNIDLPLHEGHRSGVSSTLQQLYLWGTSLIPSLDRRLDELHSTSLHYTEKKQPCPWQESTLDRPGRSLGSTGLHSSFWCTEAVVHVIGVLSFHLQPIFRSRYEDSQYHFVCVGEWRLTLSPINDRPGYEAVVSGRQMSTVRINLLLTYFS
jgi:hypothetical protein